MAILSDEILLQEHLVTRKINYNTLQKEKRATTL